MKTRIYRFGFVAGAFFLGMMVVWLLTFVGDKTLGPLEDLLLNISSTISEIESETIMEDRAIQRAHELAFVDSFKLYRAQWTEPERILLGAFDNEAIVSYSRIVDLEESLNTVFPIIHIYSAWGDKADQRFPVSHLQAIRDMGSVPMITWEPWLTDFKQTLHPHLLSIQERDQGGFAAIARGDYDFYLERWSQDLSDYNSPVFIRFAHEMNDAYRYPWGPQNNSAEEFISAWKYIYDYFEDKNISNLIWVWSPHPAYEGLEKYYPGDDYVDWIGISALNYGTVANWSEWWSFDEIVSKAYDGLRSKEKPIMVTEFASLPVGGDRAQWYDDALCDLRDKYPKIRSVLFFHFTNDRTVTYKSIDWGLLSDSISASVISECLNQWPEVSGQNQAQ